MKALPILFLMFSCTACNAAEYHISSPVQKRSTPYQFRENEIQRCRVIFDQNTYMWDDKINGFMDDHHSDRFFILGVDADRKQIGIQFDLSKSGKPIILNENYKREGSRYSSSFNQIFFVKFNSDSGFGSWIINDPENHHFRYFACGKQD